MKEPQKNRSRKPSPVALLITVAVVVYAGFDQFKDGSLSPTAAGALLALVFHWSGQGGDSYLQKLVNKWLGS